MATNDEIVVKLTAQTDQLKAGLAESAAAVKASTDAMAASAKGYSDVQLDLIAAQNAAMAGARNYVEVTKTVAPAIKEVEAASNGLAGALTRNSRTAYSASALISDAMTGQFSRSRREIAALANETGVMSRALSFALSPMGLFVGAVAGAGVGVVAADDHFAKFEQTVLSTGGMVGMMAGQLQDMANGIGQTTGHTFEAVDAVEALGASGRFTGDQLRVAAEGAVYFSEVTGQKMQEASKAIESMAKDPAKAIVALNDQYHFLTQSQAELVVKLIDTGDNAQAAAVAIQALHDAMMGRAGEIESHTSQLARDWHDVSNWIQQSAEDLAEFIAVGTGGGDNAEKLDAAYAKLARDQQVRGTYGTGKVGDFLGGVTQADIDKDIANIDRLKEAVAQSTQKLKDQAAAGAAAAKTLHDGLSHHKGGSGGTADEQAFQQAQYAAQQQGHELSLAEQKAWWQKRLDADKAGGAADANAAAAAMRHVVELQKEIDRQAEQSGREAARKRAQEAKQEAREEERAAKEAARAKHEADEQSVEDSHKIALATIAKGIEADKLAAAQGKITAQQLAQDEIDGLHKQLAADIEYYQAKAKLAAGNAAEQMKWNAAIALDTQNTAAKIEAIEARLAAAINRIQQEIGTEQERIDQQRIMSGFQEVNALIGQQETFRQAVLNIGQMILEQQEQDIAKGIAEAISGEQAKTAATDMGVAERLAFEAAGHAESLAAQGAAAVKWIMTEAAKAAASAFNALAGIPVVGPALAVAASVAAFATVAKLVSSVASAEGGWERVPADGMQTVLHRDEMVLPKHVADPIRNMAKSGSGGGAVHNHFHIQAYDRRGLADFVARNGIELGNGLARLGRNGHRA